MPALRDPSLITARQRQVIELIAQGLSNEELSVELGISPRTAKAHCDVLRQKLGVPRRRQIPLAYRVWTGDVPATRLAAGLLTTKTLSPCAGARPWVVSIQRTERLVGASQRA